MKMSLIDRNLTEDSYDEYIEKIINIFRLSSKKSSILFDLKIDNYKAFIQLSIINQEGEKQEFSDVVLKCDEKFYSGFLIPLISKINNVITIKVKDIVEISSSELVTFRMITENNDLFSIDGLSSDDANSLLEVVKNKSVENVAVIPNNDGIGNIRIFPFIIGIFIVAFIIVFLFIYK